MGGPATAPPARDLLACGDVGCLQAFRALRHFKLHLSALIQSTIPLGLYRREMNEDVFPVFPLDKSVALGCVEPLHCTLFFHLPYPLLKYPRLYQVPETRKGAAVDLTQPPFVRVT